MEEREIRAMQSVNHFALDSCPFVCSVGLDVSNGMGFLWLPNQLPCYIKDCNQFQFQTDESNLIRASRVEQYVPYFLDLLISFQAYQVRLIRLKQNPGSGL